jgi:predicted 3-demethylubiquinone-9 3-methyltransferase (glyoxalase superfamily)
MIPCADQAELDYYYDKLSAKPEAEMCGWVEDQFGVSWQLIPANFTEYMRSGETEKKSKLMKALMEMRHLSFAGIDAAYHGE